MTNLLTLAQQIEQATEDQQWEMLWKAFRELYPQPTVTGEGFRTWILYHHDFRKKVDAEAYESAAVMLKPNGWEYVLHSNGHAGLFVLGKPKSHVDSAASTAALALAAACCRAVAQEREPHNA